MTTEQFNEACFFFDQCCEVFDKIQIAAAQKRWEEFDELRKQHSILVERHKRAKSGHYHGHENQ